jgi:phosphoglycolate phosphatase
MRYPAVIFDMDGTVLNTLEDLLTSLNLTLDEFGLPRRDLGEMRHFVGNGMRYQIECGAGPGAAPEKIDEMLPVYVKNYQVHGAEKTRPYEGVPEMIRRLRAAGCKTAVVSNKNDAAVRRLADLYFPGLFDVSVGEREGIRKKPAPDSVNEVLQKLGVSRQETVYVGDSEVDVQTAENAGLDLIAVGWGFRTREELLESGAKRIFSSPQEVEAFLLGE